MLYGPMILISLISLSIPIITLVLVILIYNKVKRIEDALGGK